VWVFGYGSLVWRPSIPYEEAVAADLHGFARYFWQGSTDHRGVPGAPGRVATLVPEPAGVCRGVAYRVAPSSRDAVLARLDHREKGGYDRYEVDLHAVDGRRLRGLVYVANHLNPNWLGPAPTSELAAQVVKSAGPSGPNDEYVTRLDEALEAIGRVDPHVRALAEAVRALRSRALGA
jgi:cation transport regulator ChaC